MLTSSVPFSASGTWAVTTICVAPPAGSVPSAQRTTPPSRAQLPWPAVAPVNTTPAGSSSATCTSVAVDGPPFDTASVQVTAPPPTAPADVLTIFMSTAGPTLVCAVSVLFADTGSPWSPETVAAFVSVWSPSAAGTRTRIVAVCVAPTASAPTAHVTVCAAAVQPAPDTNVVPAGSVSAISTPVASLGPLFVTASV